MTEQQAKEYILVMRDQEYALLGPWEDEDSRDKWLHENWDNDPRDPRWQCVKLTSKAASMPPQLFAPGTMEAFDVMNSEGSMPTEQELEEISNAQ
jgi:hypothetical protein